MRTWRKNCRTYYWTCQPVRGMILPVLLGLRHWFGLRAPNSTPFWRTRRLKRIFVCVPPLRVSNLRLKRCRFLYFCIFFVQNLVNTCGNPMAQHHHMTGKKQRPAQGASHLWSMWPAASRAAAPPSKTTDATEIRCPSMSHRDTLVEALIFGKYMGRNLHLMLQQSGSVLDGHA